MLNIIKKGVVRSFERDRRESFESFERDNNRERDRALREREREKRIPKLIEYFKNQKLWFSVAKYTYNSINEIEAFQKMYENNESFRHYDKIWGEHNNNVINFMGN